MSQRGNTKPAREAQLALFDRLNDSRVVEIASVRPTPACFLPTGGEGRFAQASAPPMRAALPKGSA